MFDGLARCAVDGQLVQALGPKWVESCAVKGMRFWRWCWRLVVSEAMAERSVRCAIVVRA